MENANAPDNYVAVADPDRVSDGDDVAFAPARARDGLRDFLEIIFTVVERRRIVKRRKRVGRIGHPAHREMGTCSGAHAGDEKVVESPGLDGNLLELVAEHRNSEALQREVLADMGYDADAAGAALGGGVRFRRLRFLRSGLGRHRPGWRKLGGRRFGCGRWRRLRQSRLRQRQRKPQGDIADHVSLRCEYRTSKIATANRCGSIGRGRRMKIPARLRLCRTGEAKRPAVGAETCQRDLRHRTSP